MNEPKLDGEIVDERTVRFQRLLPGPVERVWAYLTESDKRAKWFAGGDMELRAGGTAELYFRHANFTRPGETPPPELAQAVNGLAFTVRITRCEPPHVLAYAWGDADDESEVEFELAARGDDVLLTLTHRGLHTRAAMADVSGGWHLHLTWLAHELAGTEPPRFWTLRAELQEKYGKAMTGRD